MFCKKKMWYGWKNDPHRSYYFDTYFGMNFSYLMLGKYGQEIVTSRLPRFVFNRNVKRGFSIILGKVTSGYTLSGEIHTWTDMTSERDAKGKEIIISDKGYSYPKCIEVNSQNSTQIIKHINSKITKQNENKQIIFLEQDCSVVFGRNGC